ncbi:hypothetical protein DMC30DRAFT_397159 [Rhodotorula diobovata]|uniref:FHA domain-containing protein n=1 Tax=Rhodotorula diobovata TaxID=5288 RepID=A0A5C5FV04_9BASI|nr:hypothetical protein DMC30DRAFT_397159 [Rhodotorula diobovata]
MLSDVSNRALAPPARQGAGPSSAVANNKRPLDHHSSEGDAAQPAKLPYRRDLASTSSSSSPRGASSSSPFFQRNRVEAFEAPTSPVSTTGADKQLLPTSPIQRLSSLASLPPSSPSFGLSLLTSSSTAALDGLVAAASDATASLPVAATTSPRDPGLDTPRLWHLERGTVLYFGRKARKALPRDRATTLTHVPVILPKSAKNASRIHCSVRIVSRAEQELDGTLEVEVRVTGQNGMKVDGKVKTNGSVVVLEKNVGEAVRLKFWGWDAKVVVAESEVALGDAEVENLSATRRAAPAYLVDDDEEEDPHSARRARSISRASSPAYNYSNDHGLSPEPETSTTGSLPTPSRAASASSSSQSSARALSLVASLNLDLAGLVASAIVFHARSTVAVDEVIRALLKESGGMWRVLSDDEGVVERRKDTPEGEDDAVAAWRAVVEDVLARESMFGMIDNAGLKDASGHPIPPHWYYIPDQDSSPERVAALEPFVKRVRGARSKAARYFWAKPSLRKR